MYQVVVSKTLAPKELVKVYEGNDRVVLPPWDPMVRHRINHLRHPPLITTRRARSPDVLPTAVHGLGNVLCAGFFPPYCTDGRVILACANLEKPDLIHRDLC